MKVLSAAQLKAVDAYTIEKELASSANLMERASRAVADKIRSRWTIDTPMKIFAGPGNNGGDALAIARMLSEAKYKVYVYLFNTSGNLSPDCQLNKQRLLDFQNVKKDMMGVHNVEFTEVTSQFTPPKLEDGDLIIDGLFGTGLSRPLNGGFASVVKYINASPATVVSIDVPSGLMCEDNTYNVMNHIVKANYTYTIQYPKLAFFFPENESYVGNWEVLDIGLLDPGTEETATFYNFTEKKDMVAMLKTRSKFAHKGTMGHAVLIAGKKGMAGAAILSARACMRSGLGKLTIRVPESNVRIMQEAVPEAVLNIDVDANCFSQSFDTSEFDAMAIGPGIGTSAYTVQAFIEQVSMTKCAMVIDADALTILGSHRGWINQLPRRCILTPHKKELFGLISTTRNSYEELERTRELAVRQRIYILIKGAYSAVVTPLGNVYFNSTGNPGMATAGAGDVLTGVILSLLAQAYDPEVALRLGVYLHGLAGDLAAEDLSYEGLISTDIVNYLPKAFKELRKV
ncbi:MAG: NAD(P)H-hydrate dehydratase [Bacteroidaceae bacterium]|jgi:NAD(P)H-hydrate epimerase|nr:NAD(P)H-hydrate dehydratase [Bacteroidaceae bacterium]